MALSFTNANRSAQMDAISAAIGNGGLLRIYDATGGVPASANVAISTQVLLAELTCGSPFAPAASNGVLTANAITQDSSANATGTAAFFRVTNSAGSTTVAQGTVGTSGSDINLNTTSIVSGGPVQVTSLVWTDGN